MDCGHKLDTLWIAFINWTPYVLCLYTGRLTDCIYKLDTLWIIFVNWAHYGLFFILDTLYIEFVHLRHIVCKLDTFMDCV